MRKILLTLSLMAVAFASMAANYEISVWNGGTRYDYSVAGRTATVVVPVNPAPGMPWIWRPAFFDAFPSVDKALLEQGWHIAYYDVTHCYGSPESVRLARDFYEGAVSRFGLNDKVALEGFSRGGYFCFAWAAAYPETVSSMYLDAPVCDIVSWPGRKREGLWQDFLDIWGVDDAEVDSQFKGNALSHLTAIAGAGIPIIAVCGGSDDVVPIDDNFKKVFDRYVQLGGLAELIVKPGCGHHPHSLENPEPVVDFLMRYAPGYADLQDIRYRGELDNSMYAMTVRRKACVAFLGGSITEMSGWRDMVEEDLRQRFPYTEFQFIDAGISSLGSTPHAFRFENDVLAHGVPDLLFVEAAVNDDTNGFTPRAQVRGMEGIVRHALQANPYMDIVVLDFIYDPFLALMDGGEVPDVVMNHERVANRYHLPVIDMTHEIHSRMKAGEITWEEFGGTHPAPLGHKYYAAAVSGVLDAGTKPSAEYNVCEHTVPNALDEGSYNSGRLVPVSSACRLKGFRNVGSWHPSDQAGTRQGFVDVPMLVTERGGSFEFEFDGTAVGIFCVAGPDAGVLRYRIDGGTWQEVDTYTDWSDSLYLPWVYMLGEDLAAGHHKLQLKVAEGGRQGCCIRDFVVND